MDLQIFEKLVFPDATVNTGSFTIASNPVNPSISPATLALELGLTGGDYFAYPVNENVSYKSSGDTESFDSTLVYNYLKKHYLKMYLIEHHLLYYLL